MAVWGRLSREGYHERALWGEITVRFAEIRRLNWGEGAWVACLGKHPSLDFVLGHDLMVREMEPLIGLCADSTDPVWDSLSPSLSAPPPLTHLCSLSFSQKK